MDYTCPICKRQLKEKGKGFKCYQCGYVCMEEHKSNSSNHARIAIISIVVIAIALICFIAAKLIF